MIPSLLLLLAAAGGQTQPIHVLQLACQSGQGMIIDNHGGIVDGVDVDGNTTVGCLIYSDNDKVTNITINGHKYERCGPTSGGYTPCRTREMPKRPTKIVDAYTESTPTGDALKMGGSTEISTIRQLA